MARFVSIKYDGELPDGMHFDAPFNCYDEILLWVDDILIINHDGRLLAGIEDVCFHGYFNMCNFDTNKDGRESIHNYWVKFTDGKLQEITTECPMNICWPI